MLHVRSRLLRLASLVLLVLACCGFAHGASAQQAVLLDQVVKLARGTPNLNRSEYTIFAKDFANASPASLRVPVNYGEGRIHVRLELLSKPNALETLFTLCIHNDTHQTCIRYLPKFTKPGVYEYDEPMLGQYNYDIYDFTKPVSRVIVAFKDGMERTFDPSEAGFDTLFPVEFRITMALVAKGANYVPPASMPRDAGVDVPRDAGASGTPDAAMVGGSQDSSTPTIPDASTPRGADDAPVIVEQRLVATAQASADSRIALTLTPKAPASLRAPIDFSAGKLHARVDVLAKPGGAPTQLRACVENAAGATLCTTPLGGQSYLSESSIDHEQTLTSMQSSASYDFNSPLRRAYLMLGDAFGAGVAGNAQFFPTELKATFTLLAPGAKYVPPWERLPDTGGGDGGAGTVTRDGGTSNAVNDAGNARPGARDGAATGQDQGSPEDANGSGSSPGATPGSSQEAEADDDGCAVAGAGQAARGGWAAFGALALTFANRRRRKR